MNKDIAEAQSDAVTGEDQLSVITGGRAGGQGVPVSLFTAQEPDHLSKAFSLGKDGKLVKASGGNLVKGVVETVHFNSMDEFAKTLQSLTPVNAMSYGVCDYPKAQIITADKLKQRGNDRTITHNDVLPTIARTREHFKFSLAQAVFMIDYDPAGDSIPLDRKRFLEILYEVCPAIKDAPHVIAASASSYIYNEEDQLRGAGGLRAFLLVQNGQDIERAGKVLFKRLWLAGHGYIKISKAGKMLGRALVDNAVWQPERLDFCGGAACMPPLEQKRPAPEVFNNEGTALDTRSALPDLKQYEEEEYDKRVADARHEAEPRAKEIREAWLDGRVENVLKGFTGTDDERAQLAKKIRQTYEEAATSNKLTSDFVLYPESGGTATVGELLRNPHKWHKTHFADPLEPDYRGDPRIATAYLKDRSKQRLFSFAHGGQQYTLHSQRTKIVVIQGERNRNCKEAMAALQKDGSIYARGREMVRVTHDGEIVPLDLDGLQILLDKLILCTKPGGMKGGTQQPEIIIDCPPQLAKGILAMGHDQWGLPELKAIIKAPTMEPKSGRLIDKEGYDAGTGLLLICPDIDEWPGVPDQPSQEDVRKAFTMLWQPFAKFPFTGPVSAGVYLAALLTAIIRPALRTAPGFLITAPMAGSGKSLLSECLSLLTGQNPPKVVPVSDSQEEIKKLLLAVGRSGESAVILDNIENRFGSSAVCVLLTTEKYSDRVLQESKTISVPTRILVVFNGNNVALQGDLCRRVLTCQIDPQMEEPWRRKFDLDPRQYCKDNRLEMIASGLTILRAGMQMGERPHDRTASFEDWSDIARPAVALIRELNNMDVTDPVDSIHNAYQHEPGREDLRMVLEAWLDAFGTMGTTVAAVIAHAEQEGLSGPQTLLDALHNVAGGQEKVNAKRLGRWIGKNRGVHADGLFFEEAGERNKARLWRVRTTQGGAGVSGVSGVSNLNVRSKVTQLPLEVITNNPDNPDNPAPPHASSFTTPSAPTGLTTNFVCTCPNTEGAA
ncbi:MAG TPA: hypothetical protein PKC79_03525 [Solidesulfovibrio magneticus]|nr:hypothetical protein [Solidesulfovibrio magneticus]